MSTADFMERQRRAIAAMAAVPHKILVMSGKGGVGKTTIAVNLAYSFAARGMSVGIVDADLHGPNVALMTGVEGMPVQGGEDRIEPVQASERVKVLSIASFLPDADFAVVWRGPRKSTAIQQFLGEGNWEGVDVLLVDCPPGTGDEPLSVAQLIPDADGVVIVTSPQGVSLLDSRKCVGFVREVNLPVLGIVENLAGFACPACGHEVNLFSKGGGERAAGELKVPFLGRVPITPAVVECGDTGRPIVERSPDDPAARALAAIARGIEEKWGEDRGVAGDEDGARSRKGARRIAVAAADDRGLDGEVSEHFGRCPCYVVCEVDEGRVTGSEVRENPHYDDHRPGAVPAFLRTLDVDAIVSGGMGPRAAQMLEGFGIEAVTGASGKVSDALNAYLGGRITGFAPCSHDHPGGCGSR